MTVFHSSSIMILGFSSIWSRRLSSNGGDWIKLSFIHWMRMWTVCREIHLKYITDLNPSSYCSLLLLNEFHFISSETNKQRKKNGNITQTICFYYSIRFDSIHNGQQSMILEIFFFVILARRSRKRRNPHHFFIGWQLCLLLLLLI